MYTINSEHMLEGPDLTIMESPNIGGQIVPELIILHYTAGGAAGGSARYLCSAGAGVSAHVVIGRGGEVFQLAPMDRKTWHAGESVWGTRRYCNSYALGIEMANYGPLENRDGKFFSWSGQQVDPEKVVGPGIHKNGGGEKYWERFPDAQVGRCAQIVAAMFKRYPKIPRPLMRSSWPDLGGAPGVVGHEDVAPLRKIDPGFAWNWDAFAMALADHLAPDVRKNAGS